MSGPTSYRSASVDELSKEPYLSVICYPNPNVDEALLRIQELKRLGVDALHFEGRTQIGSLNVLGKGCVSIVVKVSSKDRFYALKLRRLDANRESMLREAKLHSIANSVGVGPTLRASSENFLLMDLVSGVRFTKWMECVRGKGSVQRLRKVLKELLDQCYRLDQLGLDHGELSNLSKHVFVDEGVTIVDFETASTGRKVKNVTSATQYLFIGGPFSKIVRRMLRVRDIEEVKNALIGYKQMKDEKTYKELLSRLNLLC